ncbi:MAG: hypothetical protein AB8G96_09565 [Phycisphaerales bacterium]
MSLIVPLPRSAVGCRARTKNCPIVAVGLALGLFLGWGNASAHAQTDVGGPIEGDVVWTLDGSPWRVLEDVEIQPGASLTVEAGVTVAVADGRSISVGMEGPAASRLVMRGTADVPVRVLNLDAAWGAIRFGPWAEDAIAKGIVPVGGSYLSYVNLEGGGINASAAIEVESASVVLHRLVMAGSASRAIAATFSDGDADSVTIAESIFGQFSNTLEGGVIRIEGGRGHVIERAWLQFYRGGNGGGMWVRGDDVAIRDSTFGGFNGGAREHGGGVHIGGHGLTIAGSIFSSNVATRGGGLSIQDASDVLVAGNSFVSNEAAFGAAVYVTASTNVVLGRNSFQINGAVPGPPGGFGSSRGAGILVEAHGTIVEENSFSTSIGGGSGVGGHVTIDADDVIVRDNWFFSGSSGRGGAIAITGDRARIVGNSMYLSATSQDGGAVTLDGADAVFIGNEMIDNRAAADGGAVHIGPSGLRARFIGNTIEGNSAPRGGGVFAMASEVSFAGSAGSVNRIAGNDGDFGSGIYFAPVGGAKVGLDATTVCWGTDDPRLIAASIFDADDDPASGAVDASNPVTDPDCVSSACEADIDGNGAVDTGDLFIVLGNFGACGAGSCPADLDASGAVDANDLVLVLAAFGTCG